MTRSCTCKDPHGPASHLRWAATYLHDTGYLHAHLAPDEDTEEDREFRRNDRERGVKALHVLHRLNLDLNEIMREEVTPDAVTDRLLRVADDLEARGVAW